MKIAIWCFVAGCLLQPLVMSAADPTTIQDVEWAIWHEGCDVFSGNQRKNIGDIRDCVYDKQRHNQGAQDRISSLNDAQLDEILVAARRDIPARFDLGKQFSWVCNCRHHLKEFQVAAAQGNFRLIRAVYAQEQDHDPNLRHLLSAISDQDIYNILQGVTPDMQSCLFKWKQSSSAPARPGPSRSSLDL